MGEEGRIVLGLLLQHRLYSIDWPLPLCNRGANNLANMTGCLQGQAVDYTQHAPDIVSDRNTARHRENYHWFQLVSEGFRNYTLIWRDICQSVWKVRGGRQWRGVEGGLWPEGWKTHKEEFSLSL